MKYTEKGPGPGQSRLYRRNINQNSDSLELLTETLRPTWRQASMGAGRGVNAWLEAMPSRHVKQSPCWALSLPRLFYVTQQVQIAI